MIMCAGPQYQAQRSNPQMDVLKIIQAQNEQKMRAEALRTRPKYDPGEMAQNRVSDEMKRRMAQGRTATIKTSPVGLLAPAPTQKKTLLGQ